MTFLEIIQELRRRKLLVALGAVLALAASIASVSNVSLFPPKLNKGTLEYYSAQTQIFVDSHDSSIGDLGRDLSPMVVRANVFSRFLTTPDALRIIAKTAGVSPHEIYAEGPYQLNQPRFIQEPTAEKTGRQLIGEKAPYRLRFDSDPELPIVTVYAEAPSVKGAKALAEGASQGLAAYVTRLQNEEGIPEKRRVAIRPLGSTSGAPVTAGASTKLAGFVFFVLFGIWCLGILGVRRLRETLAASAAAEAASAHVGAEEHHAASPEGAASNPKLLTPTDALDEAEAPLPLRTRR